MNCQKLFKIICLIVILFSGYYLVYAQNKKNEKILSINEFSENDSIVLGIVDILNEGKNLQIEKREYIERLLNSFPGRILRRDTSSYFLQTALGIAYHEFVTENRDEALSLSGNFSRNVEELNPYRLPIKYGLIKFASFRIKDKKGSDDSINSLEIYPSEDYLLDQKRIKFILDFLPDLPLDLNLDTYQQLLIIFKDSGGFPKLTKSGVDSNFFDKCDKANRKDILEWAGKIWNLEEEVSDVLNKKNETDYSFLKAPKGFKDKSHSSETPEQDYQRALHELSLQIYDPDGNITVIDSLISINRSDSIGRYVDNYQNLKYQRGENREVIEISKNYEAFVPEEWKSHFYNYWGMAHLALGENMDAADKFRKAIHHRKNPDTFSGAVLNYGTALAEGGKYEEALNIFKTQENKISNLIQNINYWDGLGYIYSFFNRGKALECYKKADKLIEENSNTFFDHAQITRHFVREAKLLDQDLFLWREALKNARYYSGEDSYFNLYGTIHNALYHSEMGRFRNYLFDFEGASKDFERAWKKLEQLDSADYRVKFFNESRTDTQNFFQYYSNDESLIKEALESDNFSSLQKIWLSANLAKLISHDKKGSEYLRSGNLLNLLESSLGDVLLAISTYESKFLTIPILTIQGLLMQNAELINDPKELLQLNLLRKGLSQTTKSALEKKLIESSRKEEYLALKNLRNQLNQALAYEDSLKVKKLLPEINNSERNLYRSLKDSLNANELLAIDLNQLRKRLNKNDLAIDFIEYQHNDSIRIGAFVIFPDESIEYLDLIYSDKKDLEKEAVNLWTPLIPLFKDKDNIYFSPDGSLNYKGIEFYAGENGESMLENYKLHRVSHLRNLVTNNENIDGEIALIGVSDHNSPVGEAETLYRGNWSDLTNVEYEIQLLDKILSNYPHRVLYNDDAVEENVKALEESDISVLHFTTHGVYRNLDSLEYSAGIPEHFDHNISLRTLKTDRTNICGLILRKGNLTWQLPHLLDDEDDILTAEEIETMNFSNLQLTVLSACDSGLGEIDYDGIQGLQRAFRIAGSKNIICSLNKVNDYWSAQFMGKLYENLSAGLTIYDSFRLAQKSIREAAPDDPIAWSSYILIE